MDNNITKVVTDHLTKAIIVVDDFHVVKYLNPSAMELLDVKNSIEGKDLFDFFTFAGDCSNTIINNVIDTGLDYFSSTAV